MGDVYRLVSDLLVEDTPADRRKIDLTTSLAVDSQMQSFGGGATVFSSGLEVVTAACFACLYLPWYPATTTDNDENEETETERDVEFRIYTIHKYGRVQIRNSN